MTVDERLGRELGLGAPFADLPAYQIVNHAKGCLNGLSALISTIGNDADRRGSLTNDPEFEKISKQRTAFRRELGFVVGTDPVKAAALIVEIEIYLKTVVMPYRDQLNQQDRAGQHSRLS